MALEDILKRKDVPEDVKEEIRNNISKHKSAAESSKKSKQRYANLVSNIPVGVYIMHSKSNGTFSFEYVSPKLAEIFDVSVERFLEDPQSGFRPIHPDDLDTFIKLNQDHFQRPSPFEWEGRAIIKGEIKWLRIESTPDVQGNGDVLWNGIVIDFTERKRVEEALRQSEVLFRNFFEESPIGIEIYNTQGRLLQANKACLNIFGISDKAVVMGFGLFDDPNVTNEIKERLYKGETVRYQSPFDFEKVKEYNLYETSKSGIIFLDVQITALGVTEGKALNGYLVQLIDITESKSREIALKESEEKYRVIFNNEIYAICIFDLETLKLLDVNDAYTQLYGFSKTELISGMTIHDITAEHQVSDAATQKAINEGTIFIPLRYHKKKDGTVFPVEIVGGPYTWNGKKVMFALSHDITDRKNIEETLRLSEMDLKEAQTIAHIGNWKWDVKNGEVYWSDEMYRIFGIDKDSYTGRLGDVIAKVIHPDDLYLVLPSNAPKFAEKTPIEYRIILPDKSIRYIWAKSGETVFDNNNNPIFLTGIAQDITDRKRAEDELLQSEKRFRYISSTIYDIAYSCSYSKDGGYFIDWMTGATERITGYTIEEIMALRCWGHMVDPADFPIFEEQISGLAPGSSGSCELRLKHKNGNTIWITAFTECIEEKEKPEKVVLYGALVDITRRKQAENSLQQTRQNYETFFNTIDEFLFVLDEQGNIIHTNKTAIDRLEYSEEELVGKSVLMVHPTERREEAERIVGEMLSSKAEFCPVPIITKQGKQIPVETRINHGIWDGNPALFGVSKDISLIKQSEEKFSKVFYLNPSACGLSEIGTGRYVEVNEAFCILFGFDKNEVLGKTVMELGILSYETREGILSAADKNGNIKNFETRLKAKNGDIKHVLLSAEIIDLPNNQYRYTVVNDITDRKKAESEHMRLQNLESLGTLAGGIAHDFNNILSSILGRASMLIDDVPEGEIKDSIKAIERAAKRATGLTNQLLTFSKGGKPDKKIIDLPKLIQETTYFSLSGSNIKTEFNFRESLMVEADYGQISQVIQNLVINAKQAMPDGGTIKISTEDYTDFREQHFVKITVVDQGRGIPKDNIDKIFDPYFTTKQTGSGLGLSVCHSIINRHDGKIYVYSEVEKETTFTILLPASNQQNISEDGTKKMVKNKLNILIMDDEEEVRGFLSSMIKKAGHDVTVSKEGVEAIRIYKGGKESQDRFDLVFLDLTIKGGMGGLETVKILREYDPDIKVIVSSGYADSSVASYKEDGFDGMLKKPYTKNELNEVIFEVMNR